MSASARHIIPSPIASMSRFRVGHGTALRISEAADAELGAATVAA